MKISELGENSVGAIAATPQGGTGPNVGLLFGGSYKQPKKSKKKKKKTSEGRETAGAAVKRAQASKERAIKKAEKWMKKTGQDAAAAAAEFDIKTSDLNEAINAEFDKMMGDPIPKLNRLGKKVTHGYWVKALGPERNPGVELHVYNDKGYTPSFNWWWSVEDYEDGGSGFNGKTKDDVESVGIQIHNSGAEAQAAANGVAETKQPKKTNPVAADMKKNPNKCGRAGPMKDKKKEAKKQGPDVLLDDSENKISRMMEKWAKQIYRVTTKMDDYGSIQDLRKISSTMWEYYSNKLDEGNWGHQTNKWGNQMPKPRPKKSERGPVIPMKPLKEDDIEMSEVEDRIFSGLEDHQWDLCVSVARQIKSNYPDFDYEDIAEEVVWTCGDWPEGEGFGSSDTYGILQSLKRREKETSDKLLQQLRDEGYMDEGSDVLKKAIRDAGQPKARTAGKRSNDTTVLKKAIRDAGQPKGRTAGGESLSEYEWDDAYEKGSNVRIAPDGLKAHANKSARGAGYTGEAMKWRQMVSSIEDEGLVGKVVYVHNDAVSVLFTHPEYGGEMTIHLNNYMIEPAGDVSTGR
jgi:hypothetical protein